MTFALKQISKSKSEIRMIRNEVAVLRICKQENIVNLMEIFESYHFIYLRMEYAQVSSPDPFLSFLPDSTSSISTRSPFFYLSWEQLTSSQLHGGSILFVNLNWTSVCNTNTRMRLHNSLIQVQIFVPPRSSVLSVIPPGCLVIDEGRSTNPDKSYHHSRLWSDFVII